LEKAMNWQSSVKKLISFLPLFCGCVFSQNQINQGNDEGVYRVNVRMVTVDAQVLDKKSGHAIPALKADDFQVYEDKVPQRISMFSQDELPISVVLLFDLTDSVRPVLKPLADGALQALQHLKPEDEVAVMTYSSTAQLIQDFTTDRALATAAIKKAS
jgi:VWFA-related protein